MYGNQSEPSRKEKCEFDSDANSELGSCWDNVTIQSAREKARSNTKIPANADKDDASQYLVINSSRHSYASSSAESVHMDNVSVFSLILPPNHDDSSPWEEFNEEADAVELTPDRSARVKKHASATNVSGTKYLDSLKAMTFKRNSYDASLGVSPTKTSRGSRVPHQHACQKLSLTSSATSSVSLRSSTLSASSFSRSVRKLKAFKMVKQTSATGGVCGGGEANQQHLSRSFEEIALIDLNSCEQKEVTRGRSGADYEEESTQNEELHRDENEDGDDERERFYDSQNEANCDDGGDVEADKAVGGCGGHKAVMGVPRIEVTPGDLEGGDRLTNSVACHTLELHRDVYENNLERLDEVWRKNKKKLNLALELFDPHGLNALHLACRLGRLQYLDLFLVLANTHFFKSRTRDPAALGWTVLDEAVILGNRKYIKLVYLMLQYHQQKRLKERELQIQKSLSQTIDFCITIKWLFRSWIPLLSRYLPSDTCVLYKRGNCVRLDSTLLNFSQNSWKRGKITVLYNPEKYGGENFVFVVPSLKQFSVSSIDKPLKPSELSREVNSLLSNDVIVTKMSTRNMQYTPMKRLISRHRKIDKVGKYSATFYHWSGMYLKIFKRRDHLSTEQVSKNKHVLSDFYTGGVLPGISGDGSGRSRVPDLKCPDEATESFEDYITCGTPVGRPMKIKNQTKSFKGCVAMSDQFPLSIEKLCEILELFSNFRLFNKLKNFLQRGLPPGFPVYIEMPVFPTVQGQITMEDFSMELPPSAKEDFFYSVPEEFEKVEDLEVG